MTTRPTTTTGIRAELEECLQHGGWTDAERAERLCREAAQAINELEVRLERRRQDVRALQENLRFQCEETAGAEETAREYYAELMAGRRR